jgi:hypothetical protein
VFEITSLEDIGKYQLTDYPEYIGMSSFQYLQSHKIHDLNGFVDRPTRKARQYVEVDYSRSIAFPSSQLVSDLASVKALFKNHNATHLVERLEKCENALWENYKLGIDLLLDLYAGPDGLGSFSFSEADVSSDYTGSAHDLNKEFKKLRTSIYQTAKRISAEFRKLEQQSNAKNSP